jgi:hypothetical protein
MTKTNTPRPLSDEERQAALDARNKQRVEREAEKHRDPNEDPALKENAEQRHSSPKDRVLLQAEAGHDEVDRDEYAQKLKAEQDEAVAKTEERARQKREAEQSER